MRKWFTKNIWCCRHQEVFFLVSRIKDGHRGTAWYIVLFGYELWFGPERPGFLNGGKRGN